CITDLAELISSHRYALILVPLLFVSAALQHGTTWATILFLKCIVLPLCVWLAAGYRLFAAWIFPFCLWIIFVLATQFIGWTIYRPLTPGDPSSRLLIASLLIAIVGGQVFREYQDATNAHETLRRAQAFRVFLLAIIGSWLAVSLSEVVLWHPRSSFPAIES